MFHLDTLKQIRRDGMISEILSDEHEITVFFPVLFEPNGYAMLRNEILQSVLNQNKDLRRAKNTSVTMIYTCQPSTQSLTVHTACRRRGRTRWHKEGGKAYKNTAKSSSLFSFSPHLPPIVDLSCSVFFVTFL